VEASKKEFKSFNGCLRGNSFIRIGAISGVHNTGAGYAGFSQLNLNFNK
jgi:hypothetical protein